MNKQNSFYEFGQNFLGPICSEYFFNIRTYCSQNNIDYLGFLAREGYLFQRIYKRLVAKSLMERLDSNYIYASRSFLFRLGMANDFSLEYSLSHSFSGSLKSLLIRRFGLTEREVEGLFNDEALKREWELPDQKERVKSFLLDASDALTKKTHEPLQLYKEYLQSTGLTDAKKPLLLDVGYSGTIQKLLTSMMEIDTHGMYFIATKSGEQIIQSNTVTMNGVFKSGVKMGEGYLMLDRSLFLEGLLTAPQGQFIDIHKSKTDGSFKFTFARKAYAQNNFQDLNAIFDGAIDFVEFAFKNNIRYSTSETEMLFAQYATKRNMLPSATWAMFDVDDAISGNPNVNPVTFFGL
ncbi:HAD family hydrolase [Paraglaciecola sp. L1A13]|uniref:HAD family hydrolase n=1 Tax=Paraglaciecola sp. L1A13 TaxID=2686359 RepID=UPI00131B0A89|nr:HAD family hydrolase [Paraglaciecola sp. L1A13]